MCLSTLCMWYSYYPECQFCVTTVSDNLLVKWPVLYANIYTKCNHHPNPGFFCSIMLEDLCLAGLGLTTCDLHLGPNWIFDNIHILHSSFVTCPLNTFRWVNIPHAGLVHAPHPWSTMTSGCPRDGNFKFAMQQHRADFIFIPHWFFISKLPAAVHKEGLATKLWCTIQWLL